MCKSILIHSSVSLLLVLVLMLACHAVARLRRPKAGARTSAKNRKVFILLSISRTWGRSLSFSITSMSKSKNLHDKALASLAPPFNVHDPLSQARVVEWQTRTFEGRMPKGMRVQVPPRAPNREVNLFVRWPVVRPGFYRLRVLFAFPRNHKPSRQETPCLPNSTGPQGTIG